MCSGAPGLSIFSAPLQNISHEVTVVNVEVPVRVFKGGEFVDDLKLADFIITEDGISQKPLAVYLIGKAAVRRSQGAEGFRPDVQNRHFVLFFEMDDYLPELEKAIDLFFHEVLAPNDSVQIITPEGAVQLKKGALAKTSRSDLARQAKERIRRDIRAGSRRLRSLIEDLRMIQVFAESADGGIIAMQQKNISNQIFDLKAFDYGSLEALSLFLARLEGSKQVFLFYQKEEYLMPGYSPEGVERGASFDPGRIRKLFADASAAVHFLFITKTKADLPPIEYRNLGEARRVDLGQEFYQVFRELTVVTGGLLDTSANAAAAMRRAADAAENYYLLYYQPKAYKRDGRFKAIRVDVARPGLRVLYRNGYIDQ